MKQGKIMIVLITVIALLATILAIKIIRGTPENQKKETAMNYQEISEDNNIGQKGMTQGNENNETINNYQGINETSNLDRTNTIYNRNDIVKPIKKSNLFFGYIWEKIKLNIIPILIVIAMLVGFIKIYLKLGGTIIPIIELGVSILLLIGILTTINIQRMNGEFNNRFLGVLYICILFAIFIFTTKIAIEFLNGIGLEFKWFILLAILPFFLSMFLGLINNTIENTLNIIRSISLIILYIMINIKLADRFDKGIEYKLGLIFLPEIFLPLLGFKAEE